MGALILDFDSTLVPCESLELALARAPGVDAAALAEIEAITRRGMEGEIPFEESLALRLAIARPTRASLEALGEELAHGLSDGALETVAAVRERGHEIWIVSGAFRETLLPPARRLGIDAARVLGVRALWDAAGAFAGLDPECGCNRSKVHGARTAGDWSRPSVSVGDGATDHALLLARCVDHFVAYTEHAQRESVLAQGASTAADMHALHALLEKLLP
jgi:HAD superfamily phosphoserine phosphatase-like hydrolase